MHLSSADRVRIDQIMFDGGFDHDVSFLRVRDGLLWLRVKGTDTDGAAAISALVEAGINCELGKHAANSVWREGATYCTSWLDVVDDGPLFR